MKTKLTLLTALASLGALAGATAQTAVTPAAGYHTETATGSAFTTFGVNVGKAVSAAGDFDADATQDDDVDFTTLLTASTSYTVQNITTGDFASVDQGWTATTFATTPALAVTTGDKYEIREAVLLGDADVGFGPNNEAGILPGTSDTGDVLWLPDGAGSYTRVYYTDVVIPGIFPNPDISIGWHVVGTNADASELVLPFQYGMFFQRRDATNLSIVFTGHVRGDDDADGHGATMTNIPLVGNGNYNLINRIVPVDITLAEAGMENILSPGTSDTGDICWLSDGAGSFTRVYYTDVVIPGIFPNPDIQPGLRVVGTNADASGFALNSGAIIQRRAPDGTVTVDVPAGLDL